MTSRRRDAVEMTPIPGRWECEHCGRSLQVLTEGERQPVQPFTCVCGTAMAPVASDDAAEGTNPPHEASPAAQRSEEARDVRQSQIAPTAGIWACDRCGRRIQVTEASEHEKLQPYVCVCGATMRPGEEHADRESTRSGVVDD